MEGLPAGLDLFACQLMTEAPSLARVERVMSEEVAPLGQEAFAIAASASLAGTEAVIPPDVGLCTDCAREIRDPHDRRFHYPFTNCTNCGPRFTLIRQVPYDRPQTTMAAFDMCPDCRREYEDPGTGAFMPNPPPVRPAGPASGWNTRGRPWSGTFWPLPHSCCTRARSWQ